MTMTLNRLTLALAAVLAVQPALAEEPFVVKDIRVEGIQRTEAGTVFSYLPVKVGETMTDEKTAAAIKALYATGFFKDVRLEARDGVVIVTVEERPSISKITLSGIKEFSEEDLKAGLKQTGLAEGRVLDRCAAGQGGTGTAAPIFQPGQVRSRDQVHADAAGAQSCRGAVRCG